MNWIGSKNDYAVERGLIAVEREKRKRRALRERKRMPTFRGAADVLQGCVDTVVAVVGPAGTGKSFAALYKMHTLALSKPGFRGLLARKTRASLSTSGLVTYERFVLGPGNPILYSGGSRVHRHSYVYPNGSELEIGGLDPTNIDKILSSEYDVIFVQQAEQITRPDYETLITRLRSGVLGFEQLVLDVNPAGAKHWIKQDIDAGKIRHLKSVHKDNPRYFDGNEWTAEGLRYLAKLDMLTGVRRKRLLLGEWATPEGAVYPQFDSEVHMVDRFAIPDEWPRFMSIDFGYTNPFVCLWAALNPITRDLYVYREIYITQRRVSVLGKEIVDLSAGEVIRAVADHDAGDRAELLAHGIVTNPAYKSIRLGIQATQQRLHNTATQNGEPGIYFLRDSLVEQDPALVELAHPTSVVDEFDSYVWDTPRTSEDGLDKELPVDRFNHGMDALRYLIAEVDDIGAELEEEERIAILDFEQSISPL